MELEWHPFPTTAFIEFVATSKRDFNYPNYIASKVGRMKTNKLNRFIHQYLLNDRDDLAYNNYFLPDVPLPTNRFKIIL